MSMIVLVEVNGAIEGKKREEMKRRIIIFMSDRFCQVLLSCFFPPFDSRHGNSRFLTFSYFSLTHTHTRPLNQKHASKQARRRKERRRRRRPNPLKKTKKPQRSSSYRCLVLVLLFFTTSPPTHIFSSSPVH